MVRSLKRRRPVERDAAWIPSAVGLAISAYLLVLDRFNAAAFCVTRGTCEIVRSSAYGRILGIPVAAVGVIFFAAAFGLSSTRTAWRGRVLEILAAAGAGGAAVFVAIQVSVIHAVCPSCLAAEAAAFLLPYVECDPRGENSQYERCRVRGIQAFPTWEFHDQLVEGALSLDELARRSGYPPPP